MIAVGWRLPRISKKMGWDWMEKFHATRWEKNSSSVSDFTIHFAFERNRYTHRRVDFCSSRSFSEYSKKKQEEDEEKNSNREEFATIRLRWSVTFGKSSKNVYNSQWSYLSVITWFVLFSLLNNGRCVRGYYARCNTYLYSSWCVLLIHGHNSGDESYSWEKK